MTGRRAVVYNAVSASETVRGVERYHLGVLPALAAQAPDLRITVLHAPWQRYYEPLADVAGLELATVAPPRSRLRRGLWQLVDGGLRGREAALVHLGNVLPAPSSARAPLVAMVHDVIEFRASSSYDPFRRWARRQMVRRLARRSRVLVTVAEGTARELEMLLDLAVGSVVPVGMGVEPPPEVTARPAAERDRALVFVGGVDHHKRLDLVVSALPALPGLELRIVSAGGEAEGAVRALAARLGVSDRVRWLGRLDDMAARREVAGAAALVMPSDLEGFGIPVLEALQVATPVVISSGVPLAHEWRRCGGPVFRPGDAGDLVAVVEPFLADVPRREALGRAGTELAATYTWPAVAERLLTVWRGVLDDRRGRGPCIG